MENKKKVCSVCGCEFEGFGNNPYPINNGRCCDECNRKVIEMRTIMIYLSDKIDNMVDEITSNNDAMMFTFGCRGKHYGFAIYKNSSKSLEVTVVSDDKGSWGMFTNNEILRSCIQNYLDYNHKDKKLGKIRKSDIFKVKTHLNWFLQEYINETTTEVA